MKQLVTFALILALAACTASSPSSRPEVAPDSSPEFPETIITRDVPGEIQFDWDEAMQNIYICGRKIHFPENAEDLLGQLGEGFEIRDARQEYEGQNIAILYYTGIKVLFIRFFEGNSNPDNFIEEAKIWGIIFKQRNLSEEEKETVKECGIYTFNIFESLDWKKEDILSFFGRPDQKGVTPDEFALPYRPGGGSYDVLCFYLLNPNFPNENQHPALTIDILG